MKAFIDLIMSSFRRLTTALTTPFRLFIVKVMRMFNINVLTSKLVAPLTRKVKQLISLRPQSKKDYFTFGRYFIYKKLFLVLTVIICAGIFIYFQMFASKLPSETMGTESVKTTVSYDYDDMSIREFSGVANIRAADGTIVYTGDISGGVCSGNGKLWEISGKLVYEGEFKNNKYNGAGIGYYPSGNKCYEGEYTDNLYNGAGNLYSDKGILLYAGDFKEGLYSGNGKLYEESGILIYDGSFFGGKYHGSGKSYSTAGLPLYEGEFYEGIPQGQGILYSDKGKQIYSGLVRAGNINIDTLPGASLEDVQAMFFETPQIFYSDNSCVFVFEQAGVIVTGDCRVMVDTWERPLQTSPDGENEYFFAPETGEDTSTAKVEPTNKNVSSRGGIHPVSIMPIIASNFGSGKIIPTNSWFVGDEDSSSNNSSSSGSSNESSSEPSQGSGNGESNPSSDGSGGNESSQSSNEESSVPGFIQKQHKLYFETC